MGTSLPKLTSTIGNPATIAITKNQHAVPAHDADDCHPLEIPSSNTRIQVQSKSIEQPHLCYDSSTCDGPDLAVDRNLARYNLQLDIENFGSES